MYTRPIVRTEDIAALRRLFTKGQGVAPGERDARWRAVRSGRFRSARPLIDYHDLLLFILAFPPDAMAHAEATVELDRIASLAQRSVRTNNVMRSALMNSGISGTLTCANFGSDLSRWLADAFAGSVKLDSFSGEQDGVRNLLHAAALPAEAEAMDDAGHPPIARIKGSCGSEGDALRWLVRTVDGSTAIPLLRHALWEVMGPMVSIEAPGSCLTRTYCRGVQGPLVVHDASVRTTPDVLRIVRSPLPPLRHLELEERESLLNAARGILVGHLRETDTATLCEPARVEWQELGLGMGMAMLHLPPGRRTMYDSYVGYVAFSNAVPVAYGGAWIFPGRSKVGINVFPAFRGGPSQLLFARILQCYAQRYEVTCFEAENYQLGHGNPDGIRSGAYWFYYRCGFRSMDVHTAALAEEEHRRMIRDRSYRTKPAVLRKLASDSMCLKVVEVATHGFEPNAISEAVLRSIALTVDGDRAVALRRAVDRMKRVLDVNDMRSWPAQEQQAFVDLSPAMALITDLEHWSTTDRTALVELMRAKGMPDEDRYVRALCGHRRLLSAWAAIARAI